MATASEKLFEMVHDLEPSEDTYNTRRLLDSLCDDGETLPSDWAGLVVLDAVDTITDAATNPDEHPEPLDSLATIDLLDKLEAKTAAAKAALLAQYTEGRAFKPAFRTAATARAHRRNMSGRHTGAEVNFATSLAALPAVFDALAKASITVEHAKRIVALHRESHLRDHVEHDEGWLVQWASTLNWAEFTRMTDSWTELVDPRDPADLDPGADKRKMIWAKGVGGTTLVELVMPHLMFEQLHQILQVEFDRLLDQEWAEARANREANGDNPDDVTTADLPRTDKMRWHDALMIVIRRGGLNAEAPDPGCSINVAVTVDLMTLMWAAQAANSKGYLRITASGPGCADLPTTDESGGDGLDADEAGTESGTETDTDEPGGHKPACAESGNGEPNEGLRLPGAADTERDWLAAIEAYRCETASGVRISPQLALWAAVATHIRRVTLNANDRSTSLSSPARLFNQSQRTAMIVRDRHCRGPGCGRRSQRLEADHIQPASRQGPTHTSNGQMLCPPCHRHKTWLQAMGLLDAVSHLWDPNHPKHPDARACDELARNEPACNELACDEPTTIAGDPTLN